MCVCVEGYNCNIDVYYYCKLYLLLVLLVLLECTCLKSVLVKIIESQAKAREVALDLVEHLALCEFERAIDSTS